jgi:hypothetical protein
MGKGSEVINLTIHGHSTSTVTKFLALHLSSVTLQIQILFSDDFMLKSIVLLRPPTNII